MRSRIPTGWRIPVPELPAERQKFRHVARLRALVAQVLQKIFDEVLHHHFCDRRVVAANASHRKPDVPEVVSNLKFMAPSVLLRAFWHKIAVAKIKNHLVLNLFSSGDGILNPIANTGVR